MKNIMTAGLAMAVLSAMPLSASGHDQHVHQTYAAGEPGNPQRPSRTIQVEMSEMAYAPSRIEVKRDEQVRFVIRNIGREEHEFLLATAEDNLKHAEEMVLAAGRSTRAASVRAPAPYQSPAKIGD